MSIQYARALSYDKNGAPIQSGPPNIVAKQRYSSAETSSASSVITLTDNTSILEIEASGAPAVVRWIATSDTQASVVSAPGATANFDAIVAANTVRKFVVPIETQGTSSIVGINKQAGLYNRVAIKSTGSGSILAVEY